MKVSIKISLLTLGLIFTLSALQANTIQTPVNDFPNCQESLIKFNKVIKLYKYSKDEITRLRPDYYTLQREGNAHQQLIDKYREFEGYLKDYMKAADIGYQFSKIEIESWEGTLYDIGNLRHEFWYDLNAIYRKKVRSSNTKLISARQHLGDMKASLKRVVAAETNAQIANNLTELIQTIDFVVSWSTIGYGVAKSGMKQQVRKTVNDISTEKIKDKYEDVVSTVIGKIGDYTVLLALVKENVSSKKELENRINNALERVVQLKSEIGISAKQAKNALSLSDAKIHGVKYKE